MVHASPCWTLRCIEKISSQSEGNCLTCFVDVSSLSLTRVLPKRCFPKKLARISTLLRLNCGIKRARKREYSHLICTLTMTQRLATPMENASMENFCSTWCSLESLRLIEFDVGGLRRCSEFCKFDINYFRDFLFIYLVKQSQLSITILRTQFNNSLPDDFIRLKPMDY